MAWSKEEVNEIYVKVQRKAVTDAEFRAELLKSPKAAIEKLVGVELPESYNIKVIENDPAYAATFVLPPAIDGELSDEDLEGVAGGDNSACGADGCGAQACAGYVSK